ncbi:MULTISPECIES: Dps family protein [unclassified Aeromicrobium]|jgi:starvation-inducible DNA-binding protein|uniref:Dps family protein n=1 Tax=unclassified Aeromicrobium TaxID=2633570 RepID=UPI0006F1D536|nr:MULTISPECIES: DNA starvation/stationary phase protection protein [unclassified Aeromicrobium]RYY42972.1 MAG: DNA starvation/stationary phase protection protein [Actinomycetales bacterium]KQO36646.1 DNA starvation/stationary phase protection protein [Aeromicrobium sp. Leaf245]KQP27006.1 DNA starvation/stationary phase protection protein [Aeromicrobium sp. Leaf272]KQP78145.1 DNA starvation/stationary phase protection protein [Aeromicrobium sp. Leaf289]KQP83853.1 DNA starvation/stationary phas
MTSTTHTDAPSALATTSEIAAGVAQFLTPVVHDLEALVVDGKQAHWHVRGGSFAGVHALLDDLVAHAQDFADTAAERIVALGLPLDSRLATVAAKSTLPALSDGFQPWQTTVAQTVAQIDAALVTVRAAVAGLDDIDLSSQDVAIEIERGLTKDRWLLQAHIAA